MSDLTELRKRVKELRAKQVAISKASLEDLKAEIYKEDLAAKAAERKAKSMERRTKKLEEKKALDAEKPKRKQKDVVMKAQEPKEEKQEIVRKKKVAD
jgi:predicted  nucleic acid-binding Zn-ribbon protein